MFFVRLFLCECALCACLHDLCVFVIKCLFVFLVRARVWCAYVCACVRRSGVCEYCGGEQQPGSSVLGLRRAHMSSVVLRWKLRLVDGTVCYFVQRTGVGIRLRVWWLPVLVRAVFSLALVARLFTPTCTPRLLHALHSLVPTLRWWVMGVALLRHAGQVRHVPVRQHRRPGVTVRVQHALQPDIAVRRRLLRRRQQPLRLQLGRRRLLWQ